MANWICIAYLEHLNIRHAEVEIRLVAHDQAATEQKPDRKDSANKDITRHVNILRTIQQVGCALQYTRTNGLSQPN